MELAVPTLNQFTCFHAHMPLHALQMRQYANASQKQSLNDQLAQGEK